MKAQRTITTDRLSREKEQEAETAGQWVRTR